MWYHNGYIGIHIGINIRWYIKWNLIFLYAINNHFLPFLYLDREISLFDILWLITQFKISFNLEFSSLSSKTSNPIRQSGFSESGIACKVSKRENFSMLISSYFIELVENKPLNYLSMFSCIVFVSCTFTIF